MKSTLFIYSSTDGQTKTIISRIKSFLSNDIDSMLMPIAEVSGEDIAKFDRIIIGASIRYGKHKKELYEFIDLHLDELKKR